MKTVVRVRWLLPLDSDADVLVLGDFAEESWPVRLITNTLANVEEPMGESAFARPAGVGQDQRYWRWAVPSGTATATAAATSSAAVSSSPATAVSSPATAAASPTSADAAGSSSASIDLREPELFGTTNTLRGDTAYPSNNRMQWLSDQHLANGHVADERPEGEVPVRYNYPRSSVLIPKMFSQRPAQRVLHECSSALIQQYCDRMHWHNLGLVGPEKRCYHWEPYGKALPRRSPEFSAFRAAAPAGWELVSITAELQADGHSCGDWSHHFRCCMLKYVADPAQLGTRSFATFLLRDDLRDLHSVSHAERAQAERTQRRFAQKRRDALRSLLLSAAQRGALPHGRTHLTDFDSSGKVIPTIFINLDEDLPGDDEFSLDIKPRVDTAAASTAAATASAASPAASTASVPDNDGEERPTAWCKYNPNDHQAAGIADAYVRAKSSNRALHNVSMDVDLFLDLAGIRYLTQTWPNNRGDKLQWGHKGDHEAMATNFNPGRPYLKLRRLKEVEGSLNIFPRWEVYDHEGRHRAWWIKNNMQVQRLEVWIAVDFDAAKRERTLCPTDLVVEQGACGLDGKNQTGGIPVSARLWRAVDDAVDELVRAEL